MASSRVVQVEGFRKLLGFLASLKGFANVGFGES